MAKSNLLTANQDMDMYGKPARMSSADFTITAKNVDADAVTLER